MDGSAECRAFLVRLWRDGPQQPWRATVKQVSDGLEFHFSSPEKLLLFLHEKTTGSEEEPAADQQERWYE